MVSTLKDGVSLGDTSRIPHSARTRISTHVETDVTLVGVTICNITSPPPFLAARPIRLFSISDPVFIERHAAPTKQVFSMWYGYIESSTGGDACRRLKNCRWRGEMPRDKSVTSVNGND